MLIYSQVEMDSTAAEALVLAHKDELSRLTVPALKAYCKVGGWVGGWVGG